MKLFVDCLVCISVTVFHVPSCMCSTDLYVREHLVLRCNIIGRISEVNRVRY